MPEDIYDAFVRAVVAHGYVRKDKSSRRFKSADGNISWLPNNRLAIMLALDDVLDDDNFMLSPQIFKKMNETFHYAKEVHMYEIMRVLFVPRGQFVPLFEERGIHVTPLLRFLQQHFSNGTHIDEVSFKGSLKRSGGPESIYAIYKSTYEKPNSTIINYFRKRVSVRTVARVDLKSR